jgi:hypothetical protein
MKKGVILAVALSAGGGGRAWGQQAGRVNALSRPGETKIFFFKTASGKTAVLYEGPKGSYLVYRFGTATKVELQYPTVLTADSWRKFTYSSYHRSANPVAQRYWLSFSNGGNEYQLFDMMDAATTKSGEEYYPRVVGVSVTLPKGKIINIDGRENSIQGDLALSDEQKARVKKEEDE